jgi:hypothetical protein
MIEGKTIARVIDSDWIVFTDGTGIRARGDEDQGGGYDEVTAEEIREYEAEQAADALRFELRRDEQQAWMMRTCEERAEIRAEWLAAQPKTLIPRGWADAFMDDMIWDANSGFLSGPSPPPKARCPKCNERSCPNAPDMKPPNRGVFHQSGTITITKRNG